MTFNPLIHHRRSVRLREFDYSQAGAYFITICCYDRKCLFGAINNGNMLLNPYGEIAYKEWMHTLEIRTNIELGSFVVMPNHIHGIIHLHTIEPAMNDILPTSSTTIAAIVRGYKASVTKQIRDLNQTRLEYGRRSETNREHDAIFHVWQRNYYEHVIRSAASLQSISQYIINNPATWSMDELYRLR
jgi:putative transposase